MRQRTWWKLLALLLGLTLMAAACGKSSTKTTGTTPGNSTTTTAAGGSGKKIGLVYDIGGRGDKSFNDAAAAGLDKAKAELGVVTKDLEPKAGGSDREELLRLLADDGYDMVIAVGFNFATPLKNVQKDYPKTTFAIVDDSSVTADNVTSLVFAEEQGSYLVGAAAALQSKTKHIGFIGGVEVDLIKKFEAGYIAGAKSVTADIKVDVKYISQPPDFSGFNDTAKGQEIGKGMYDGGADVVYHAAGGSGSGLFEAAKQASASGGKKWAIGVDSDQYQSADASVKEFILTSMLKRVDVAVFSAIKAFNSGTLKAGVQRFDLSNDGIGYATSGGFVDAYKTQLDALKTKIASGAIKVPDKP